MPCEEVTYHLDYHHWCYRLLGRCQSILNRIPVIVEICVQVFVTFVRKVYILAVRFKRKVYICDRNFNGKVYASKKNPV